MRVVVLTTSWPRSEHEFAGRFVADAVERLRERGVEVDVVAPGRYRDFGLAYGGGMAANLRRRPWAAPLMLLSMLRAVRRAARGADLVHAHWLLTAAVARFAGKPFVVTLHGSGSAGSFSDVELARRRPSLVRALLRPAASVVCVSETVAAAVRAAGVEAVVIPNGVRIPPRVAAPDEPPHPLYVGRLSPEKNVDTLVEAVGDLGLVVAGDGPLRHLVPDALGAVPHAEVERLLERSAVVVAPCEREGFGLAAAEAMSFGRPVVAAAGGALLEFVADGETGLLVPPRDVSALRQAVQRLLGDRALRERLGAAARDRARERFGWEAVIERTLAVYRDALAASPDAGRRAVRLGWIRTGAGDDYDEAFMDAMASEYERRTAWTRMRLENVRLLVDPRPGDRVLDVGSATGTIAHFLSTLGCETVGVDLSERGIARARAQFPGIRFEVADAAALPFPDASFDKVVAADVTEHLDDDTLRRMLREAHRVLVPGGTLSIHTPNPAHVVERLKAHDLVLRQNPTHVGLRTGPELRAELGRAGFDVELDLRRPGFFPLLGRLERLSRGRVELLGYRICIRARARA